MAPAPREFPLQVMRSSHVALKKIRSTFVEIDIVKRLLRSFMTTLLLAAPLLAHAADGFVTSNVNLRAGPDQAYPAITVIPNGAPVAIQGCTSGWEWCDVIALGNRGWVAGDYLQYTYQNQPVLVPAYGARIGIPIVSFVIGSYWDSYYRDRPFYRQRNYWYGRPPLNRPPPRPIHRPPPRPPGGWQRPPSRPNPGTGPGHRPRPPGNQRPGRPPPGSGQPRPNPGPGGQRPGGRPGGDRPAPGNRPQGPQQNR